MGLPLLEIQQNHSEKMGKEQNSEYYDHAFKGNAQYLCDPDKSKYYDMWNIALSWLKKSEWLVELGSGTGQFAELALSRGYEYLYGVDFSKEAVKIANERIGKRIFYEKNIVYENPFVDSIHETVICFETLEHIEDDIAVVKKVQSGKRFIFSVPNFDDPGHVRTFRNEKEVLVRYGDLLNLKQVFVYSFPNTESKIFLFDTVRKI